MGLYTIYSTESRIKSANFSKYFGIQYSKANPLMLTLFVGCVEKGS